MNSSAIILTNQLIKQHLLQLSCPDLKSIFDHHFKTPGKQIRPQIILSITEHLNHSAETLAPWAACCELFHNGTLIHDDLQDGDTTRRGQPSVWKAFGQLQAINAGDMLLLSPPLLIGKLDVSSEKKLNLQTLYSKSTSKVVYGQALEPSLLNNLKSNKLDLLYEECTGAKTAELFKMCVLGVAIILGLPTKQSEELANTWFSIGLIFQIQDDLLDIYGNKGREQTANDLREGKVSSLIVELIKSNPSYADELKTLLESPRENITTDQVNAVINLFNKHDIPKKLNQKIEALKNKALTGSLLKQNSNLNKFTKKTIDTILN